MSDPSSAASRLSRNPFRIAACVASSLVLAGVASASIDYDLSTLLGNNGFRLFHNATQTSLGTHVAPVGDVNGDGIADFLTSGDHPFAYLVFGKPSIGGNGIVDFTSVTSASAIRISGPTNEQFGGAISGLGDINGDGFADFAIGSPLADLPGKIDAGRVYVVFGFAGISANKETSIAGLVAAHGFTLRGEAAGDRFGSSLGGGADVNGDGFSDFVIGSPDATTNGNGLSGRAYVLFGGTGFVPNSVLDVASFTTANSISLLGPSANQEFGRSVALSADMNGDGRGDIVIGDPGLDATGSPGAVFVVFGPTTGAVVDTAQPLTGIGFKVSGSQAGDQLGIDVAAIGDFNGDGIPDIAAGAPHNGSPFHECGQVNIVFGGPNVGQTGFVFVQSLSGTAGVRIDGDTAENSIGFAVGGPGDVNGDGYADVLTASRAADPAGLQNAGEAYVIYGGPDIGNGAHFNLAALDELTTGVRFAGVTKQDDIGDDVSGAGDINGDGRPDILIASRNAKNPPATHSGEVYAILSTQPAPLSADIDVINASVGGVQTMLVNAGSQYAGKYYYTLGSITGTSPGTPFAGFAMPLIADPYFSAMLTYPNSFVQNSMGLLDANGRAEMAIYVPTGLPSELTNLFIYHAYFVYDQAKGKVKAVSNPVSLRIVP